MKSQFRWLVGLLPATIVFGAVEVCAEPIIFYFEGQVTFIDSSLALDPPVLVGTPFTGGYSFDPTGAMDSSPGNPNVGNYFFASGRMWTHIGSYTFETRDLIMYIWNNTLSGDLYQPISVTSFAAAGMQWGGMAVVLGDGSGTALNSDALPLEVPDLADYPSRTGLSIYFPWSSEAIRGNLTSLTPEPSSLAILAVGAFMIAGHHRRG